MIELTVKINSGTLNKPGPSLVTITHPTDLEFSTANPAKILITGWIMARLGLGTKGEGALFEAKFTDGSHHAE
jgi:hypothetical protein